MKNHLCRLCSFLNFRTAGTGRRWAGLAWAGLLGFIAPVASAGPAITNEFLRVEWRPEAGSFQVQSTRDGRVFAPALDVTGARAGLPGEAGMRQGPLGLEQGLEVKQPDGAGARVSLKAGLPFVLVRSVLANPTSETRRVNQAPVLRAKLDVGPPAADLKALGTAGLKPVDGHPGSYVFLAVADPRTRAGVVAAWLTHDRGCGVLFSSIEDDEPRLEARVDYGRLMLAPGQVTESEVLALGWFADARLGLERYADAVARYEQIFLPPQLDGYCTWYSRPHGGASDATHLVELADFAARELKPFGLDFIQIDDLWQDGQRRNGPAKIFLRHKPDGPYPDGIKPVADRLAGLGLITGLWWMPFAGDREDPFFADKRDWFVKRPDGTPYWARWGGTSLDLTRPTVRDYVARLAGQISRDWGCGYFKMDGLWTGIAAKLLYVNDGYREDDLGEAVFHDPSITPIQAYRAGLKLVREAAGKDVFLLGCNVSQNMRSFGASFGRLDAMRIGPDNGPGFKSLQRGPWHGANRWFLHRRVWYNDPDPVYVRASMPLEHARLLCSWVALSGELTVASDWLPELPAERLDLLKRILPNHGGFARPVDVFERDLPAIWHLRDDRGGVRRDVIGCFNWDEQKPLRLAETVARLGLPKADRYEAFDYWANKFLPPFAGRLELTVPPGDCRILAVRPAADRPQVLSTSRHVTQGVVDLAEERWDAATCTLHGVSRLVAGDPCELRIVLPDGPTRWQARQVELPDAPGGATARLQQTGRHVRLRLSSPRSGPLHWSLGVSPCY